MKIMVLVPGELADSAEKVKEEIQVRKEYYLTFASPGTQIEVSPTSGTKAMLRGRDIALIVPSAIEVAIRAEKDGYDAIAINAI